MASQLSKHLKEKNAYFALILAVKNGGILIFISLAHLPKHYIILLVRIVASLFLLMEIQIESIVVINAISIAVITGKCQMDNNVFNSELQFQISLAIAKSLAKQNLLTDEEFNKFKTLLLQEYAPPISLLTENIG
ncbi:MAG: hypothetical protein M0R38_11010 [Bacteroidia bacterium]|nr:hypothetical protein [Bacteroidia bacterium]